MLVITCVDAHVSRETIGRRESLLALWTNMIFATMNIAIVLLQVKRMKFLVVIDSQAKNVNLHVGKHTRNTLYDDNVLLHTPQTLRCSLLG